MIWTTTKEPYPTNGMIISNRAPSEKDFDFTEGQIWHDKVADLYYFLVKLHRIDHSCENECCNKKSKIIGLWSKLPIEYVNNIR